MGNCMSFNSYALRRMLCSEANEVLQGATGVNVLGKYNEARYTAGSYGLNIHPDYAINAQVNKMENKLHGRGADGNAPKLRNTPKEKLVSSVAEFIVLRDKAAKSPIGGAVALIHALLNWANPATRELGHQLLVLATAEENLVTGSTYKGYALNEDMLNTLNGALQGLTDDGIKAALASLVVGTAPQTGYVFDASQIVLAEDVGSEEGQNPSSGTYTVYFWSTGSDYPRSVEMHVNKNGIWKANQFSGLLSEVAKPPVTLSAADEL